MWIYGWQFRFNGCSETELTNPTRVHVCSSLRHYYDQFLVVSLTAKSASECVYTCTLSFLLIVTLCAVHAFHLRQTFIDTITYNWKHSNYNVVPAFPLNLIMSDSTTHTIVPTAAPVPAASSTSSTRPCSCLPNLSRGASSAAGSRSSDGGRVATALSCYSFSARCNCIYRGWITVA